MLSDGLVIGSTGSHSSSSSSSSTSPICKHHPEQEWVALFIFGVFLWQAAFCPLFVRLKAITIIDIEEYPESGTNSSCGLSRRQDNNTFTVFMGLDLQSYPVFVNSGYQLILNVMWFSVDNCVAWSLRRLHLPPEWRTPDAELCLPWLGIKK